MLGVFAGFGEIGVQPLDRGIESPVRHLAFHAGIARLFRSVLFQCSFITILIFMSHTPSHGILAGCTKLTNHLQRIAEHFLKEEKYSDFAV